MFWGEVVVPEGCDRWGDARKVAEVWLVCQVMVVECDAAG